MARADGQQRASGGAEEQTKTMPSYMKPAVAADHAQMLHELREYSTLKGRDVESWSEEASDDGLYLFLRVTYAPLDARTQQGLTETYRFPALGVLALEGKR